MITMTTTYEIIRRELNNTSVDGTGFGINDQQLYIYDDTRKDGDETVAVFPAGAWFGVRVLDN